MEKWGWEPLSRTTPLFNTFNCTSHFIIFMLPYRLLRYYHGSGKFVFRSSQQPGSSFEGLVPAVPVAAPPESSPGQMNPLAWVRVPFTPSTMGSMRYSTTQPISSSSGLNSFLFRAWSTCGVPDAADPPISGATTRRGASIGGLAIGHGRRTSSLGWDGTGCKG